MGNETRRTAAVILAVAATVLMSACSFGGPGVPSSSGDLSPSPSPSLTATPSPSASPDPSPSGSIGPIESEPNGSPVTPEIFLATVDTDAGVLNVVVLVPGIYEDGGTCTVTVKDQSTTVNKSGLGASDVSSTACGQFTFALAALPSGTATITASYQSTTHSGTSAPTQVDIP